MSQPKLLCRITAKQASMMAAIAIMGLITILSAFFMVSDSASNSYATSVNSEITAEVDGTHYVTLSAPDVTFSINPTDSAQLSKQNINVSVETNAPGGADLYLSMANSTNALHLNGDTTSTAPAIESTASSVAANSFATNTWGYSTNDQTYSAVPTNDSDPALLAAVDGSSVGSNAGGVITASIPVYYAAKVDTSIPAGSYSNRLAYSAVVDGGIITEATLTKIEIDGAEVDNMQSEVENTLTVTTNLMTNTYGTPRVYLESTSPAGYQECGGVVVSRNESGYMTITCKVIPTQAATGVTLHIVPKGSSDDRFCADGTYTPDTSDCEAGEWKWGSLVVGVPDIVKPINGLLDITNMQDMTPEICANSAEGDTKRLVDVRDDKMYWVAKLADGNCWMTQNLALNFDDVTTLTPSNSDVRSDWAPEINMFTLASQGSRSDSDLVQAWHVGDYVWATPGVRELCYSYGGDNYAICPDNFVQATGMTPMTALSSNNAVIVGNTYDAHYETGYLYSWNAATAGSGIGLSDGEAPDSICPSGWSLPTANNRNPGSFYYLLNQYGFATSATSDISFSPLYLLYNGYIWPGDRLVGVGNGGAYWSSTPHSDSTSAYDLYLASTTASPNGINSETDYSDRSWGFSVRCVAGWE